MGKFIRLRVRGTGNEKYDWCYVKTINDKRGKWIINAFGKEGLRCWWQCNQLFVSIGELKDLEYTKVGYSYGGGHI